MEETLNKLYYNVHSPAAYSGVADLYQASRKLIPGIKRHSVKEWLKKQYTYSLHHPIKRKYRTSKYFVSGIDKLWQVDLADMSMISNVNEGYNFILTCIDVFSKFAWAIPIKHKHSTHVVAAFKQILLSGRKPESVQSDRGSEFLNEAFQKQLKQKNIKFFTCNNPDIKCSIVERFNRTMKTKIWKYFTKHRTYKYIDVLPDFIKAYNNRKHGSTKLTPTDASKSENTHAVYHNLYHGMRLRGTAKFKKGDLVRISKAKKLFEKGYLPNWSEELFTISKVVNSYPPKYNIMDLMEEKVQGGFYEQELQRVTKPDSYWVEKVIKRRRRKGITEFFVKWFGYPEKFNSWITQKDGFLHVST